MAYVCKELETIRNIYGSYDCALWIDYVSLVDLFAITQADSDMISTRMLVVVFGAWSWRQVHNIILRRRY